MYSKNALNKEILRRRLQSEQDNIRESEELSFRFLTRNQKEVAKKIIAGDYHFTRQANGWGFIDEFFIFMKEIGFLELFDFEGKGWVRQMLTVSKLLLTYSAKILLSIKHMNEIPELLFGDIGLMLLLGFTAEQVKNGICERGQGKHNGPIHKDTLSDALARFQPEEMEKLINGGIKILVKKGFLKDERIYIMDTTDIETTEKFEGCGSKTIKGKETTATGEKVEIGKTIFGYKLHIIRSVESRIIVAAKLTQIEERENEYMLELVKQARKNIGKDRIKILVIDRGYLDGINLWELKQSLKIDFVIPARTNMQITADARGLRKIEPDNESTFYAKRQDGEGETEVLGIKDLTSYDEYGDVRHNKKNRNTKEFNANPINAVMVMEWGGKKYEAGHEKIFLTTLSVEKPFNVLDIYDLRSLIENTGFRELKQGWFINILPNKIHNGVVSHVFLTLCMYNMSNAYRTELGQELEGKGIIRYMRETRFINRDKNIIISGQYFALFNIEEFLLLLGKPPKYFLDTDPEAFRKEYGLKNNNSSPPSALIPNTDDTKDKEV